MADVIAYDQRRDARTFPGGMPIVAHPPCRSWSAFCRHQAKPEPGEQALGLWCVEQVRKWGGVLEQPAHSHLWKAAGLPRPGNAASATSWSIEVWQSYWGYPMRKATWLYFSKINIAHVDFPLLLHGQGGDRHYWRWHATKKTRSATVPAFAEWLVAQARKVVIDYELAA